MLFPNAKCCLLVTIVVAAIGASSGRQLPNPKNTDVIWKQIPGPWPFSLVSAKNGHLWGITRNVTRNVMITKYNFQTQAWEEVTKETSNGKPMPTNPLYISATNDGSAWLSLDRSNHGQCYCYLWNPTINKWDAIDSDVCQVAGDTKDQAIGIKANHQVVQLDNGSWKVLDSPVQNPTYVVMGDDNERWMALFVPRGGLSYLYRANDTSGETHWDNIDCPDTPFALGVQSPSRVLLVTSSLFAYMYTGDGWNQLPQLDQPAGPTPYIDSGTIDYNNVYVIDWYGNVYVADY